MGSGEFTQHNWRPLPERVEVGKRHGLSGGYLRAFLTAYTRRCTRCGCVMSRPGTQGAMWVEGRGFVPPTQIDNRGHVIATVCSGRVVQP